MIDQIDINLAKEDEFPVNSIFVIAVNAAGVSSPGVMQVLARKYPKWFKSYKGHCTLFQGHENELMGSLHSFAIDDTRIIVSCFNSIGISKNTRVVDYDATTEALRKIEFQVKCMNARSPRKWKIYMPESSIATGGVNRETMTALVSSIFEDSQVEFTICRG